VPVIPLKPSDSSIAFGQQMKAGIVESDRRLLHIDDNAGVLVQYNDEKTFLDFLRTRYLPFSRARECVVIHALLKDVASSSFYKQYESLFEGIIDFKSEEQENKLQHYVRVRSLRGRGYDSRWRRLRLLDNGEVTIAD